MKYKVLTIFTSLSVLAATGGMASAQSETEASSEELSPEAMEILCERFPLNSRCEGNASTSEEEPAMEAPAEEDPAMSEEEPAMEAPTEDPAMEAPAEESSPEEVPVEEPSSEIPSEEMGTPDETTTP